MTDKQKDKSEHFNTMCDILDGLFPKGECAERGAAIVMVAYIDMLLQGVEFGEDGRPGKLEMKS